MDSSKNTRDANTCRPTRSMWDLSREISRVSKAVISGEDRWQELTELQNEKIRRLKPKFILDFNQENGIL